MPPPPTQVVKPKPSSDAPILGHGDVFVGDKEDKFHIQFSFFSNQDNVILEFVSRCTRYPVIPRLFRVFRDKCKKPSLDLSRFLNMYSGVDIKIPSNIADVDINDEEMGEVLQYTHLPDIVHFFGAEVMEALLDEFAVPGEIRVPSSGFLASQMRDVDIMVALLNSNGNRSGLIKSLASHYSMKSVDVQKVARRWNL